MFHKVIDGLLEVVFMVVVLGMSIFTTLIVASFGNCF